MLKLCAMALTVRWLISACYISHCLQHGQVMTASKDEYMLVQLARPCLFLNLRQLTQSMDSAESEWREALYWGAHDLQALLNIISNPVNSTVPIAVETLKKMGVYDPNRVFGVTQLDVVSLMSHHLLQNPANSPWKMSKQAGHNFFIVIQFLCVHTLLDKRSTSGGSMSSCMSPWEVRPRTMPICTKLRCNLV